MVLHYTYMWLNDKLFYVQKSKNALASIKPKPCKMMVMRKVEMLKMNLKRKRAVRLGKMKMTAKRIWTMTSSL